MDMLISIAVGFVAAILITIVMRRAGDRYGKIRPSGDIKEAYESFRVDSNKNYYISGSDIYPNAIIGVDKKWTLESDLWKAKDPDSLNLKELVQNMQAKVMELNGMLHGFCIYDNRGRIIGDSFSVLGLNMTVKITGENRVMIDTPPVDTYR